MSSIDVVSALESTSYNLIVIFIIEIILLLIGSIFIIIYKNLLSHRGIWISLIAISLITIILGVFIIQDPSNSETDVTMFTLDLIIIPAILFVVVAVKLIYEKMHSSPSAPVKNSPTVQEKQILKEPKTLSMNTRSSG